MEVVGLWCEGAPDVKDEISDVKVGALMQKGGGDVKKESYDVKKRMTPSVSADVSVIQLIKCQMFWQGNNFSACYTHYDKN